MVPGVVDRVVREKIWVPQGLAAVTGERLMGSTMVFGSSVSATSWEPFRRAIEVMTEVFSLRTDLVPKHAVYLAMINLEPPVLPRTKFVRAVPDTINPGVLDEHGNQKPIPNWMYVDDCLLASVRRFTLGYLAACIEAIFVLLGAPNTALRQNPLVWINGKACSSGTMLS